MDSMLQVLVLSCPASQLLETQIILKVWYLPRVGGFTGPVPHCEQKLHP